MHQFQTDFSTFAYLFVFVIVTYYMNILASFDKPPQMQKNNTKHIDTFSTSTDIGFDREKCHEKININVFK